MVLTVILGGLLVASVVFNVMLWQHVKVVEENARQTAENYKRDNAVQIYGLLDRRDWESLGMPKYELLDAVGALNYCALMNRWYGAKTRGHYIAQAESDRKGKDASPLLS